MKGVFLDIKVKTPLVPSVIERLPHKPHGFWVLNFVSQNTSSHVEGHSTFGHPSPPLRRVFAPKTTPFGQQTRDEIFGPIESDVG